MFVSCGVLHTVAVLSTGVVVYFNQTTSPQPILPLSKEKIVGVQSTSLDTFFSTGTSLLRWNMDNPGQVSLVETPDNFVIQNMVCGGDHILVTTPEGKLYTMGLNKHGQLGRSTDSTKLMVVDSLNCSIRAIGAGSSHSLAITEDGKLYSWGLGVNGQLGLGDRKSR